MTTRNVVIVDVDGTVALRNGSQPGRRGPFDWSRVCEDDPNTPVIELVKTLRAAGYTIIWMSGRSEVCRADTTQWLWKYCDINVFEPLYMRSRTDFRADDVIKREMFDRYVRDRLTVKWVIDDRDKVVKMWRELGLTVLQVADGDF